MLILYNMKNIIYFILVFIFISCTTTKYIDREVPVETIKTEYINKYYKDSIYVHDSIDKFIKGDTVYQYKYKYIYKYLNKTDTLIIKDTIPTIINTVEYKEINVLKWYQKVLQLLGIVSLLCLIYIIVKKVKK